MKSVENWDWARGGPEGRYDQTTTLAALCPDLLRYEQLGDADGGRGHIVRAFFWLLRVWPVR